MSILGFLFLVFVLYLAYRLIFDFIIPVYRTTRRIKKGFREMSARMNQSDGHERVNQHTEQYQQQNVPKQDPNNPGKGKVGDYIDFEEIKD